VETVQNIPFDWAAAREALKTRLGSEVVSRWLDPLSVGSVSETLVVLEAPNPFFRDWVASQYLDALKRFRHIPDRYIRTGFKASSCRRTDKIIFLTARTFPARRE
jgi:chromosomal replication initiation ATPase DnaA